MKNRFSSFVLGTMVACLIGFGAPSRALAGDSDACTGRLSKQFKTTVSQIMGAYQSQLEGNLTRKGREKTIAQIKSIFPNLVASLWSEARADGDDGNECAKTLKKLKKEYDGATALGVYAEEVRRHASDMIDRAFGELASRELEG